MAGFNVVKSEKGFDVTQNGQLIGRFNDRTAALTYVEQLTGNVAGNVNDKTGQFMAANIKATPHSNKQVNLSQCGPMYFIPQQQAMPVRPVPYGGQINNSMPYAGYQQFFSPFQQYGPGLTAGMDNIQPFGKASMNYQGATNVGQGQQIGYQPAPSCINNYLPSPQPQIIYQQIPSPYCAPAFNNHTVACECNTQRSFAHGCCRCEEIKCQCDNRFHNQSRRCNHDYDVVRNCHQLPHQQFQTNGYESCHSNHMQDNLCAQMFNFDNTYGNYQQTLPGAHNYGNQSYAYSNGGMLDSRERLGQMPLIDDFLEKTNEDLMQPPHGYEDNCRPYEGSESLAFKDQNKAMPKVSYSYQQPGLASVKANDKAVETLNAKNSADTVAFVEPQNSIVSETIVEKTFEPVDLTPKDSIDAKLKEDLTQQESAAEVKPRIVETIVANQAESFEIDQEPTDLKQNEMNEQKLSNDADLFDFSLADNGDFKKHKFHKDNSYFGSDEMLGEASDINVPLVDNSFSAETNVVSPTNSDQYEIKNADTTLHGKYLRQFKKQQDKAHKAELKQTKINLKKNRNANAKLVEGLEQLPPIN